jgi:hypothetical protein
VSRTDRRSQSGQATIETMLIAFLGVVFLSVAFQFYLTNRSISRTLQEVHGEMLSGMWEYNNKSTKYDAETVKVIWTANHGVPSASSVPRVGLLQDELPEDLHIYSDWVEQHGDPDYDCEPSSPPCKRTKAGGGLNAGDPWDLAFAGFEEVASGDYFGWIWFNGESAALDLTGLKGTLQDAQSAVQTLNKIEDCMDDFVGCAFSCVFGDCPWDD